MFNFRFGVVEGWSRPAWRVKRIVSVGAAVLLAPLPLMAQGGAPAAADDQTVRIKLPVVTVTAQKEPEDQQKLPVSVTAVTKETIDAAGLQVVSDAAIYAPNTHFTEFTTRKLSNARFRGIGSSPANPGITTYFDGVPQLNANSSNIDLLGVGQIELVRGPQSALFGRNALGGVVNVSSARPSTTAWTGSAMVPFGNFSNWSVRGDASGPLSDTLSLGVALSGAERDGYTVNSVTGNDLDSRSAFAGKGQLLWTPSQAWEARVIVSGERARDGDYALNDLGALRRTPYRVTRDFEGGVDRDIFNTTILATHTSDAVVVSSTTGFVRWTTEDVTDLDYSPFPLATRDNAEQDFQFTQEVRIASTDASRIQLSDNASLRWQGGLFVFTQRYDQEAVNTLAPFLLSPFINFPVRQYTPRAALDDAGLGVYGQAIVALGERLDLTGALRVDYERKNALLESFFEPQIAPPTVVDADDSFANVSPQFAAAYRLQPTKTVYGSVSRGFKAGGFNAASPTGSERYGEEQTWNLEAGVKTSWAGDRVTLNAAAFVIDWADLQLNLPNPLVPAQFYIANAGAAVSRGVEVEATGRPAPGVQLFGAFGYTNARVSDGSRSSGVDVSDNKIPNAPAFTATVGAEYARMIAPSVTLYGRGEVASYGAFEYDDLNSARQDAYSLANFRGGVRVNRLFAEGWIRNAFDTRYVPLAFAYSPELAPSGFVGELGAPRTFGISAGVRF